MNSSSLLIITGKLTVALAKLKYRQPLAKILPKAKYDSNQSQWLTRVVGGLLSEDCHLYSLTTINETVQSLHK